MREPIKTYVAIESLTNGEVHLKLDCGPTIKDPLNQRAIATTYKSMDAALMALPDLINCLAVLEDGDAEVTY